MKKLPNFQTISELLADINEQFEALQAGHTEGVEVEPIHLELFEATVQYFAANVSVFRKTQVDIQAKLQRISAESVNVAAQEMPGQQEEELLTVEAQANSIEYEEAAEPEISAPYEMATDLEELNSTIEEEDELVEEQREVAAETPIWQEESPRFAFEDVANISTAEERTPGPLDNIHPPIQEYQAPERPVAPEARPAAVNFVGPPTPPTPPTPVSSPEEAGSSSARPRSLNEILGSARQSAASPSSPAPRVDRARVSNLKSAISLNDKLLFIKDLFNGYSLAYSEAIELLNRFDSFEEADNFLKSNYAEKNAWTAKQETADKFYHILQKRFQV